MKLRSARRPAVIATAALAALALGMTGSAVADALITSSDIKDETIKSADIKNGTVKATDLARGSVEGSEVLDGSLGYGDLSGNAISRIQDGVFVGNNWGVELRNTIAGGTAMLRSGPASGPDVRPPLGSGSLQILTADANSQVVFGNEVDYAGKNLVSTIGNNVGFSVFSTGENKGTGGSDTNLPNIKFEIDPNVDGTASNYGTLNFTPTKVATSNKWTSYDQGDGFWWLTGAAGAAIDCEQGDTCTFAQIKSKLANATILTLGVGKGRDLEFQGAVDALRIGDTTFDFEVNGVTARRPA